MKKVGIILLLIGTLILVIYIIPKNMQDEPQVPTPATYSGKIGELINYTDHPLISIGEINIKYEGVVPPEELEGIPLGDIYKFNVSSIDGKSYDIEWSWGTGEPSDPIHFTTSSACYKLEINVVDDGAVENTDGKLVLHTIHKDDCSENAVDLRS